MSTEAFNNAVEESKTLTKRPSNEELLKLYGLFKQATEGDNTEDRPGGFDFKAIAKHDAWAGFKGMEKAEAESTYITFVSELKTQYS